MLLLTFSRAKWPSNIIGSTHFGRRSEDDGKFGERKARIKEKSVSWVTG